MNKIYFFLWCIFLMCGCAAIKKNQVMRTEGRLSVAGFTVIHTQSAAQLDELKAMRQHEIVMQEREGRPYYTFYDAQYCQCSYMGSKTAYWQYLTLIEKENSEELFDPNEDAQYGRSWIFSGGGR